MPQIGQLRTSLIKKKEGSPILKSKSNWKEEKVVAVLCFLRFNNAPFSMQLIFNKTPEQKSACMVSLPYIEKRKILLKCLSRDSGDSKIPLS